MQIIVNIDPIDMTDPQPPTLSVMVAPGSPSITPELAKATIEGLLEEMGLSGIPFRMIGQIERHVTDAAGNHAHLLIDEHAHS